MSARALKDFYVQLTQVKATIGQVTLHLRLRHSFLVLIRKELGFHARQDAKLRSWPPGIEVPAINQRSIHPAGDALETIIMAETQHMSSVQQIIG